MQLGARHRAPAGPADAFVPSRHLRPGGVPVERSSTNRRLTVAAAGGDRVVCVGEALFDFLANEKGLKREEVKSWTPYPGGAPANVATALTKLGVPTAFVSALGNDERGEEIMNLLSEIGVDTTTVQRCEAPTRDIYVERTLDGDRMFAGFGLPSEQYCDCFLDEEKLPKDVLSGFGCDPPVWDPPVCLDCVYNETWHADPSLHRPPSTLLLLRCCCCCCRLLAPLLPAACQLHLTGTSCTSLSSLLCQGADIMVTGTLGLAAPKTRAAMRAAAQMVKAGGGKVMIDVNWRPVFWQDLGEAKKEILDFLDVADIVKISDADLEFLYDMQFVTALLNPCAVADRLPNAPAVLVTAGEEGAAYCCRSTKGEHTGFVPVFKVDIADTTGAGDAFTAGFVYKLLEAGGLDRLLANPKALKEAVVFAAATGGLTCTKPGAIAAQPSLEQVQALFEESKGWYNFWGAEAPEARR